MQVSTFTHGTAVQIETPGRQIGWAGSRRRAQDGRRPGEYRAIAWLAANMREDQR